ncbi:hypothetical protein DRH29_00080 [candidate division Kazan bacterium]|uniref:SIR2-like domain-containing protein n=1 Tax=candidate division Kazan bacterium TaxID=2202143 RepID=A0A420ZDR8_UNCK3|nr:MAG: hypothetical protein DRH29_00080 [candidate division Kazan bacterium]
MKEKVKTVLIFGAGASYDCGNPTKIRIPMSRDIYNMGAIDKIDQLRSAPTTWSYIRSRASSVQITIQTEFEGNTEKYLDSVWDNPREQQFMIDSLYYLRHLTSVGEVISGNTNNYQKLFDWVIKKEEIRLSDVISFNYDTILDSTFCPRFGIEDNPKSYLGLNRSGPRLIKPHGSANWYVKIPVPDHGKLAQYSDSHRRSMEKVRLCRDFILQPDIDIDQINVGDAGRISGLISDPGNILPRPCIILPLLSKAVVTNVFPEIMQATEDAISKADHLILIGYRGADDDFTNILSNRLSVGSKKLVVSTVGMGSAVEIRDTLVKLGATGLAGFAFTGGFTRFIDVLNSQYSQSVVDFVGDGYLCVRDFRIKKDFMEQWVARPISDSGVLLSNDFERLVKGQEIAPGAGF